MIVKCTKCHHEWQAAPRKAWLGTEYCDWCGAPGKKIGDDYMDKEGDVLDSVGQHLEHLVRDRAKLTTLLKRLLDGSQHKMGCAFVGCDCGAAAIMRSVQLEASKYLRGRK